MRKVVEIKGILYTEKYLKLLNEIGKKANKEGKKLSKKLDKKIKKEK